MNSLNEQQAIQSQYSRSSLSFLQVAYSQTCGYTVKPVSSGHPNKGKKIGCLRQVNRGWFALCLCPRDPKKVAA